jgi:hypothetical protein
VLYTVCNHVLADQIFPGHVGKKIATLTVNSIAL